MNYEWSVSGISAKDGLITHAKYLVIGSEDDKKVTTEGNWYFKTLQNVPFDQVTEQMVCDWIKNETTENNVNLIESRLKEQLDFVRSHVPAVAPWLPQVFTPEL
jgi:hypothetical protein